MSIRLVNLTPHPITVVFDNGEQFNILPSGITLRAEEKQTEVGVVVALVDTPEGEREISVPLVKVEYGQPVPPFEELPGWDEGALYIVSGLAAQAIAQHAPDVLNRFLLTSRPVRDPSGRIVGIKAFATLAAPA